MWLLNADIFGRKCCETVTANNGKLRSFVLCNVKRSVNEKEELLCQQSAIFATAVVAAWRKNVMLPGARSRFGAPMFQPEVFLEANVLYWRKYLWHETLWRSPQWFGAPIVIRRQGNCAPLVTPLCSRGHFRYGVERAKRFVNVHLHCIVSNMERISKISSLLLPGKVSADVHASDLNFFHNAGIFPTCFGCFLPANTTKKILWIIEK